MKTALIALLMLATVASPACSAFELGCLRVGNTRAMSIAKDSSIPGKNISGKCLSYALALNRKFQKAGIASRIIGYHYQELAIGANNRGHAVVAFNDGGRTYIMDNETWTPQWVEDSGTRELAAQFAGMNTRVVMAWTVGNRSSAGSGESRLARHQSAPVNTLCRTSPVQGGAHGRI